jgi:hypothetical protein
VKREQLKFEIGVHAGVEMYLKEVLSALVLAAGPLERGTIEGESPVVGDTGAVRKGLDESGCLGMQPQMGGTCLLKLNSGKRPIANKYREGKMKRTLKRE